MLDHLDQISIPATVARGPVHVNAVILYSLVYDAADVMDNDNIVTALSAQIQISIALIGMVRNLSVESIVLARRWKITSEKVKKTIQAKAQRGFWTMFQTSLSRLFRMSDRNGCYHHLTYPLFSGMTLPRARRTVWALRASHRCCSSTAM